MSTRQRRTGFHSQRYDGFCRRQPGYAAIILNNSVFPAGVRTKTLGELQQNNEAACMLDYPKNTKPEQKTHQLQLNNTSPTFSPRYSSDTLRSNRRRNYNTTKSSWITTENKHNISDIRDHMYINTYCPREKPMRYKEVTLPRISNERPWSVSEGNPSRRVDVSCENQRQQKRSSLMRKRKPLNGWLSSNRNSDRLRAEQLPLLCDVKRIPIKDKTNASSDKYENNIDGSAEVVQHSFSAVHNRSMGTENGKYRPFSTVSLRQAPRISVEISSSPKLFVSVYQYMKYVETKTLEGRVKESHTPVNDNFQKRFNTALSQYHDPNSRALQFVMSVNRPLSSKATTSSSSAASSITMGSR